MKGRERELDQKFREMARFQNPKIGLKNVLRQVEVGLFIFDPSLNVPPENLQVILYSRQCD